MRFQKGLAVQLSDITASSELEIYLVLSDQIKWYSHCHQLSYICTSYYKIFFVHFPIKLYGSDFTIILFPEHFWNLSSCATTCVFIHVTSSTTYIPTHSGLKCKKVEFREAALFASKAKFTAKIYDFWNRPQRGVRSKDFYFF